MVMESVVVGRVARVAWKCDMRRGDAYSSSMVEFWLTGLDGQGGNRLGDWDSGGEEGEGNKSGE